jgi:tetratricopeptide (TPR) repeat protein
MTKTVRQLSTAMAVLFLAAMIAPLLSGKSLDDQDRLLSQKFKMTRPDLTKGEKQLKKKELDKAEETLLKVLKEMPENAQASFFLAETYYQKGDFEKGLAAIVEAERNFPLIQKFLYGQQTTSFREGEGSYDQGIIRALSEDEKMAGQVQTGEPVPTGIHEIHNQEIRKQATENQPVTQGVKSAVHTLPAEYSYVHGNLLFREEKYEEALAQYEKAIAADPKHEKKLNNIAVANLYYMGGQYDKALKYIEKAEAEGAKVDPGFKNAVLKALGK